MNKTLHEIYDNKLNSIFITQPKVYDKKIAATVKDVLDRPSVKAVIYDFDSKCNWSKLALAVSCLQRKDVLYIAGTVENWIHVESVPSKMRILGEYINTVVVKNVNTLLYNVKISTLLIIYIFFNIKKLLIYIRKKKIINIIYKRIILYTRIFITYNKIQKLHIDLDKKYF